MKTILIGTSKFGSPVSDYFNEIGNGFNKKGYKVIFVFDGLVKSLPSNSENQLYFSWPNERPTKVNDFVFLYKIIKKYQPVLCLSNFGSTNVISIVSYLCNVKYRVNYIHTTSKAIINDSQNLLKTRLLKYRKIFVLKLNNFFFTNSSGTKEDAISAYFLNMKKIEVCPLLIKDNNINFVSKLNREFNVVIVGGLSSTKGHKQLIYQFLDCVDKLPLLKLKIIGEGYLKEELIKLTKEIKIEKNVEFLGKMTNLEVQNIFATSLISISSSIDEAFGLVNIEALRAGTPIICTKTAGSLDILNESFNGEFFNHEDRFSLYKSINKIVDNWEYYSANARLSFQNNYNIYNNIDHHVERFFKVINN